MHWLAAMDWAVMIEQWIAAGGYFVLFGVLLACGLGLPLPEDIPLIVAGALVGTGKMQLGFTALAAWGGIVGGDLILYHLGRKYGLEITRLPFIGKHVTRSRIEKAEGFFAKYGVWVVAIGRLFAGIRAAMVVAAGATRFSFWKFLITDGIAAFVSGALFVALGYWLGSNLPRLFQGVERVKEWVLLIGAAAIVAGVLLYLAYRKWIRSKHDLVDEALEVVAEKTHTPVPHGEKSPKPNQREVA